LWSANDKILYTFQKEQLLFEGKHPVRAALCA
jgi:hypothetical protein